MPQPSVPPLPARIARPGMVYLVGAGPGAADLITVRGWSLLHTADVVVYDSLADPALWQAVTAERIDAGKRAGDHGMAQDAINALLVDRARQGQAVVRLKGGDPYVLGRGSEEALVLAAAGVPFEVVPGLSSSLAAPLLAGIPLTHRGVADAFCVVSGHPRDRGEAPQAEGAPSVPPYQPTCTLVVLMGVRTLDRWLPVLADRGYPPDLPVAFVTWAARPEQSVLVTDLAHAAESAARAGIKAPTVTVIGRVVALREPLLGAGS